MTVGIDNISPGASTGVRSVGGMRTYIETLVQYLPALKTDWHFKVFTPSAGGKCPGIAARNIEVVECRVPIHRPLRVLYEQLILPEMINKNKVDVWLGTCNVLPLILRCPAVLIVQSLQFFTNPQAYSATRRYYLQCVVPRSVRQAKTVIALSETSKRAIASRCKVSDSHITVVYHSVPRHIGAVDPDVEITRQIQCSLGPFILCVSALYPYKNMRRLIEAFSTIKRDVPHYLVISGGDTPELTQADLKQWAATVGVADRLITLGRTSDSDLVTLYRTAEVMALPSLDETFGFPVLEAMYMGCPVLTSMQSSMAEIAGDAAVLVNPSSTEEIARGLKQVLLDGRLRQTMSQRGRQRAAMFNDSRMLRELVATLESFVPKGRNIVPDSG